MNWKKTIWYKRRKKRAALAAQTQNGADANGKFLTDELKNKILADPDHRRVVAE
jgi:hypothetical protein